MLLICCWIHSPSIGAVAKAFWKYLIVTPSQAAVQWGTRQQQEIAHEVTVVEQAEVIRKAQAEERRLAELARKLAVDEAAKTARLLRPSDRPDEEVLLRASQQEDA
ncbi:MAG: hypothetical protein WC773_00315 [Patescibacteria group bacterium]